MKIDTLNNGIIIGVSGKIGSGKDAVAKLIAKNVNTQLLEQLSIPIWLKYILKNKKFIHVHKKAFAYKLKCIVQFLTNYKMQVVDEKTFTNKVYDYTQFDKNYFVDAFGMTIGNMLQKVGTDAIRNNVHTNAWVEALFVDMDNMKENDIWVITDVRFKNEANAIKERNGFLIRVNGDPLKIRENSTRDLNHQSEVDLDDYTEWDYVLENNGTLHDLEDTVNQDLIEPLVAELFLQKFGNILNIL